MFFSIETYEVLDGLAALVADDDPEYTPFGEMTFEADSLDAAREFIDELQREDASTWSDSHTSYREGTLKQVDGPGEYHYEPCTWSY